MVKKNAELTKEALVSLEGKWGVAVGTFFLFSIILSVFNNVQSIYIYFMGTNFWVLNGIGFLTLVITTPFFLGLITFFLNLSRGLDVRFVQIFDGFKNFGKAVGLYFLTSLLIGIGFLFFIIPGIIAGLMFSQVFFILADNKDISVTDALDQSARMMKGYKTKYFGLGLRFIPWALLCVLTLGIGFLWLVPYMYVSFAKFYDDIKANPIGIVE